ncbi:glucosaminidase domain-containing protein [soil metagenome]
MKSKNIFLLLLTVIFLASCGSKKKTTRQQNDSPRISQPTKTENSTRYADVVEEYINTYAEIAMEEMRLYNIPASITLAQGILESGAGRGELTRKANNHFGIKCHEWKGPTVFHDDDSSKECFRKYNDPKYSYRDHSLFLAERKRYAGLFELDIEDYKGWAKGLREAGYATDRLYPNKLIDIIDRYQLHVYDTQVLGKSGARRTMVAQQGKKVHNVQKGDTLYSIARRYNTTIEHLQKNNNLRDTNISIGQKLTVEP